MAAAIRITRSHWWTALFRAASELVDIGVDTGVVLHSAELSLGQVLLSATAEGAGCAGKVVAVQGCLV